MQPCFDCLTENRVERTLTPGSHTAEKVDEEGTWRSKAVEAPSGQEVGRVTLRGPLSEKQTPPMRTFAWLSPWVSPH